MKKFFKFVFWSFVLGIGMVVGLVMLGSWTMDNYKDKIQAKVETTPSSASTGSPIKKPVNPKPIRNLAPLELGDWHWSNEHGYAIVEGVVKNVSGSRLKNVMAVVTFYTKNKKFITSSDSLLEYNPVMPGQTSPFKVMVKKNPQMHTAYVDFKTMFGGRVDFIKKKK